MAKRGNKKQNQNGTKMKEMLDSKTGGEYVDFEVDDPEEEKPVT